MELYSKLNEPNALFEAIDRFGKFIANSGMFGCTKTEQGQVLAMECLCQRKSPSEIARTYHILDNKLSKKALAALAEFRTQHGGKHEWEQSGDEPATTGKEDDRKAIGVFTPKEGKPLRYEYSIADAKAEGLIRPGSRWTKRPGNMLRARCITNALGMLCPEIFAGSGDDGENSIATEATINLGATPPAPTSETEKSKAEPVIPVHAEVVTDVPIAAKSVCSDQPEPTVATNEQGNSIPVATPTAPQPGQADAATLPDSVCEQLAKAIGPENGINALRWMRNQQPPWLLPGQGFEHLTKARVDKILRRPDAFIRAIAPQSEQKAAQ